MRCSRRVMPVRAVLLSSMVVAALLALPVSVAVAAPRAQGDDEAQSIFLGEYVLREMTNGETATFQVEIQEQANYMVTPVDADEAVAFDLVMSDADGNEVFNDVFDSPQAELAPGIVTLEFTAVDDAVLEFVVLGEIGTMSSDPNQPGKLPSGGIYTDERINNARYGLLSVPETTYPQQVLLYAEPGEADSFTVSAEGDDIGFVSISTDDTDLLQFWTNGGDYLITAEPDERRSTVTLIPFLSGPPNALTLDEPLDGSIAAGSSEAVFELVLDSSYDNLTIDVESDADVNVSLVDRLYDGNYFETSSGEPSLEVSNVSPGVYYVLIETDPVDEDTDITITASGEAGAPIEQLTSGAAALGEFAEGDTSLNYAFEVSQPGALVTVDLTSDEEDTDFDLAVGLQPGGSAWTSYLVGSNDSLAFVAPTAGTYYISVISNDGVGNFAVTAEEGDIAPEVNLGGLTWGEVRPDAPAVYRLIVDEPGDLLTVMLVGPEGVDVDVTVSSYNADGESQAYASGFTSSDIEIIGVPLQTPGLYQIAVTSGYSDGGEFALLTRVEDPNGLAGGWAIDAVASSEYGTDGYSALQATGAPNTPNYGDQSTAWAAATSDGGEETLELTFEHAIVPKGINVYETSGPGAIVRVEALDPDSDEWTVLWEGEAQTGDTVVTVFSPELTAPDFATDVIRLTLDTAAVPGWNEIDAVQLLGRPQQ